MKIYGFIPARMAASRFTDWYSLAVATCDVEISDFCDERGYRVAMTDPGHTRAIDRCAEAAKIADQNDIVVVVQGDEPLLSPDMIDAVVKENSRKANQKTPVRLS